MLVISGVDRETTGDVYNYIAGRSCSDAALLNSLRVVSTVENKFTQFFTNAFISEQCGNSHILSIFVDGCRYFVKLARYKCTPTVYT